MKTELTNPEILQLANNYANAIEVASEGTERPVVQRLTDYTLYLSQEKDNPKRHKVAFLWICVNPHYWEYAKKMVEGARQFFLPGHDVDYMVWSDVPKHTDTESFQRAEEYLLGMRWQALLAQGITQLPQPEYDVVIQQVKDAVQRAKEGSLTAHQQTIFPIEPIEWPMGTLLRYHLFLQEEERLKDYDYIFYCDVDMQFVDYVGDEILGEGLTAAQHPMYALRENFYAPFEPNPDSSAYVKHQKQYYAGGFQGGKTKDFLRAMRAMRQRIDEDMDGKNYIARWNDESHWNRYLQDVPPSVVLSPSYVYPDSLHEDYYFKIWPQKFFPKIVTLTKKFTTSVQAGDATKKMLGGL